MKAYAYILASKKNGTLYVGTTSNLTKRLEQHRLPDNQGFTGKYNVHTLVWFEEHELISAAINREKRIKKYPRQWKLNLIEELNPDWNDLADWLM